MSEIFVSSEHKNLANAAARTVAAGSLSEHRKCELSDRGGRWHEGAFRDGQKAAAMSLGERVMRELSDRGGRMHQVAPRSASSAHRALRIATVTIEHGALNARERRLASGAALRCRPAGF